jgi:tellurite methyltransferase
MTDSNAANPPSPFIARWVPRVGRTLPGRRRALDVAAGRGRHSLVMAAAGFHVTGIDIQLDALRRARASAHLASLELALVCADLTTFPLPRDRYDLVVVTRYLDRALFPALRETLVPGGVLLYETFTEAQVRYGRGPRSPEHLLEPGELRMLTGGMDVLFEEELTEPDAVARIAARRM